MSFEERLEAVKARKEELRAQNDERVKTIRESFDAGNQQFVDDMKNLKWAFGEVSAELNDQADALDEKIENQINKKIDEADERREKIRAKIADIKTNKERADLEDLIVTLLVYAGDCAEIAAYYWEEADFAMAAAEEQIMIYNEKFAE